MQRLDKLVADHGSRTRKQARALIRAGRVQVDGVVVNRPEHKAPPASTVHVDGQALDLCAHIYLMLNKPAGVLSATRDDKEQTVLDLVPPSLRRDGLFPVGRLDRDATGLLLLTDDGALAHRLLAPGRGVPKTYRVTLNHPPDWAAAAALFEQGLRLDGRRTAPAQLRVLEDCAVPIAELTVYEGIYHEVKRMFAAAGCEVTALERVAFGPLHLDPALARAQCRALRAEELALLQQTGICASVAKA